MSGTIRKILQRIIRAYSPERVILFGSAARGDVDAYSDIDIIIVADFRERYMKRLERSVQLLPYAGLDVFLYTPREFEAMVKAENRFILSALEGAKILYEKPKRRRTVAQRGSNRARNR
jgi:predicted nucleotidyltransferase